MAKVRVIGATDGNIIATIITSHVTRNRPALSTAMPPIAMELACEIVNSHAAAAHTRSAATIAVASGLGSRATCCMSGGYADQRKGAENALLPLLWNSIPKALICDSVGRATVMVVFEGWNTPTSWVGSVSPWGV